MNTLIAAVVLRAARWLALVGACVVAASVARPAGGTGRMMDLSIVAETFAPNAAAVQPSPAKPVTCAVVDAGYVEAGDPMAGDPPPPAALVADAVRDALASRGYRPAPDGTAPALVVVYTWGVIRPDSIQIAPIDRLSPNNHTRLQLVARRADADRIEQDLVADKNTVPQLRISRFIRTEKDRETLALARDSHYFVVLSAYDGTALRERQKQLVWQVKLTTQVEGHSMSEAVLGLLGNGAPYFGQNLPDRRDDRLPLVPAVAHASVSFAAPAGALDPSLVADLVKSESDQFSGGTRK